MLKVLETFQPKSELDEKLLGGILMRPEKKNKDKNKNKNKDLNLDDFVTPRPARLPVRDRMSEKNLEPPLQPNSYNVKVKPSPAVEMSDRQMLNVTTSRENSRSVNNGTSIRDPREPDAKRLTKLQKMLTYDQNYQGKTSALQEFIGERVSAP